MEAHSTAVDLCQNAVRARVHVNVDAMFAQLRSLEANHLWLREQLTQLQHDAFNKRISQQRKVYEARAALECQMRQLQLKYKRNWGF